MIMSQYNPSTEQPIPPSPTTQAHYNSRQDARQKWFEEMRGWIMVLAVLVVSVTYTTGLCPPGGLWQDEVDGHKAGSSILHDKFPLRYTTFFYANATAFMTSLVIIILLMNEEFYGDRYRDIMLKISMVLDLVSLMIAYAAGCARRLSTSIYVIVQAVGVSLVVFCSANLYSLANNARHWVVNVVHRDCSTSSIQMKDRGTAQNSSI